MTLNVNPVEFFWARTVKSDGCWKWAGTILQAQGYGTAFLLGRGHVRAHRLSWEIHFGTIPPGMHVCHHCDNPPCVRPDHLFLGTHSDNMKDMYSKGRGKRDVSAANASRLSATLCKRGHPFTEENTKRVRCGGYTQRLCRTCTKERRARYFQLSKGVS